MKTALAAKLESLGTGKAVLGFDGFVDEVVHVVKTRLDQERHIRMETLKEYGEFICAGSGLSSNVEILTIRKKPGGNGVIMADALDRLGYDVSYIGCVGKGAVDPVFCEMSGRVRMAGIAPPAQTDAMEFFDGKLIRSKLGPLNAVSWADVLAAVPPETMARMVGAARLVGFLNWSLVANMSGFYKGFLEDVVPLLDAQGRVGKTVFFDLADPEKRPGAEIKAALGLIGGFSSAGFDVVLGLNKKEACEIAALYGMEIAGVKAQPLRPLASFIQKHVRVACLVIHPADRACCLKGGAYAEQEGPYTAQPVLTTGAGDNFNAGFAFGHCAGLAADECLLLGNAASGFYVRAGRSGTRREIAELLRQWGEGRLNCY
ncbi:MAG: carbohydrate kinase family protein [Clostridiales Family XIII bacterium]|jgi:sugar/nucleoside kinase (ribokinase family)|nr:carbohydrate kinase family protein [Clostridiales Family XIII bacterium]